MEIDIDAIKKTLEPHLEALKNFQFSVFNPLFWIALLILFLILSRRWDARKSFGFCSVVAILLLVTSQAESFVANFVVRSAGVFDPIIIRIISTIIFCFISIYYIFMK